jgi:hypothetical protein
MSAAGPCIGAAIAGTQSWWQGGPHREASVAIRNQTELRIFLQHFELDAKELSIVVDEAIFLNGKCLGLNYGPLRTTLSLAQFDKLLKELSVSMLIGGKSSSDEVCPNAYPNPAHNDCVYKDNYFCNITAFGKTTKDCPEPP